MFEELRIYLDLVEEFGDPFTIFERGWERDEDPAPPPAVPPPSGSSRHSPEWFEGNDHGFPG